MPSRYLLPGVIPTAAAATVGLAACRVFHVLVTNWWNIGLPALIVAAAYLQARVDAWAAGRKQR